MFMKMQKAVFLATLLAVAISSACAVQGPECAAVEAKVVAADAPQECKDAFNVELLGAFGSCWGDAVTSAQCEEQCKAITESAVCDVALPGDAEENADEAAE